MGFADNLSNLSFVAKVEPLLLRNPGPRAWRTQRIVQQPERGRAAGTESSEVRLLKAQAAGERSDKDLGQLLQAEIGAADRSPPPRQLCLLRQRRWPFERIGRINPGPAVGKVRPDLEAFVIEGTPLSHVESTVPQQWARGVMAIAGQAFAQSARRLEETQQLPPRPVI